MLFQLECAALMLRWMNNRSLIKQTLSDVARAFYCLLRTIQAPRL